MFKFSRINNCSNREKDYSLNRPCPSRNLQTFPYFTFQQNKFISLQAHVLSVSYTITKRAPTNTEPVAVKLSTL